MEGIVVESGGLIAHACRFPSGSELVKCLQQASGQAGQKQNSSAVFVITAVGSLREVTLRMANAQAGDAESNYRSWNEPVEIVSLVGTFAVSTIGDGEDNKYPVPAVKFHLHLSLSDASGRVFGGHLVSGKVHTTVELVLGSLQGVHFDRALDAVTGYRELVVSSSKTDE